MKYAVIGNGSWATALVKVLLENLPEVYWWVLDKETKTYIENHEHNPDYLSDVEFEVDRLHISTDAAKVIENADVIVLAVPSIYLPSALANYTGKFEDKVVISAIKGIIPNTTWVVGEYLKNNFDLSADSFAVISGPSHAEEVASEQLTYLTIAATNNALLPELQQAFNCDYINTTTSNDPIGIEYATTLKNIYALAAGIAHGLRFGDNFQALLMSNAIRETKQILDKIRPGEREICGSAYLGDLLVTGYSLHSRNRRLGNYIGKGYTIKAAIADMNMVAEGYYATQGMYKIIKENELKAPILKAVYKVLFKEKRPKKAFKKLSMQLT